VLRELYEELSLETKVEFLGERRQLDFWGLTDLEQCHGRRIHRELREI
jgi:hypothetical protein